MADPTTQRIYFTARNKIPVEPFSTGYSDGFGLVIPFTLAFETGGDVSTGALHKDPGNPKAGLTKYGIAQGYNPEVDVPSLTRDQAIEHLRRKYWDRYKLGEIEEPLVQATIFDYNMNSPGNAGKVARKLVEEEGRQLYGEHFRSSGPLNSDVVKAINLHVRRHGAAKFTRQFNEGRRLYYSKTPWAKGLIARVDDLEAWATSRPFPGRAGKANYDEDLYEEIVNSAASTFSDVEWTEIPPPGKPHQESLDVLDIPMESEVPGVKIMMGPQGQMGPPQMAGPGPQGGDPQDAQRMQVLQAIAADPRLLQMVIQFLNEAQQMAASGAPPPGQAPAQAPAQTVDQQLYG